MTRRRHPGARLLGAFTGVALATIARHLNHAATTLLRRI